MPTLTGAVTGLRAGDTITGTYTLPGGTTSSSAPGTYTITTGFSDPGSKIGNYNYTLSNGTLTIKSGDQIPPTATITLSKVYTQSPSTLHYDYNITFNANDNTGGSGVQTLYYYETGAQTKCSATTPCAVAPNSGSGITAVVSNWVVPAYLPTTASVPGSVDTAGTTVIYFWAVDNSGNIQAKVSQSLTVSP